MNGSEMMLQQNSWVSWMFFAVSVVPALSLTDNVPFKPSLLVALAMTETMIVGGLCETILKYDIGARLDTPFALMVDMKAMGRGV
jgi:hypothetical protein